MIIENAPWAQTPSVQLNPGLVAIIGARGSGKTALADIIAAGCDSYFESTKRPSFLARAQEHLLGANVTLKWLDSEAPGTRCLDKPVNDSPEAYKRARYLSQQFVEDLCSIEGMPGLIKEIERVIFEAHPSIERDGAVDFDELLQLRASRYREARAREEAALANLSDQIGIELEKSRQVATLKAQIIEKVKLLTRYQEDRRKLLPKGDNKNAERLQALTSAAEKVRGYLRAFAGQQASIGNLRAEVADLRQNRAPEALRSLKERHQTIRMETTEWDQFLLKYSGDVDTTVSIKAAAIEKLVQSWKGVPPTTSDQNIAFLSKSTNPENVPLAVLEAESGRLEKLVSADRDTARKLNAVSSRIAQETVALERLREKLGDCQGARERTVALATEREQGYARVFEALLTEERVLNELYAPLMKRMEISGGTLAKLSFTVRRIADVNKWAKRGEDDLFDLRGGPFRGIGSLEKVATEKLANT